MRTIFTNTKNTFCSLKLCFGFLFVFKRLIFCYESFIPNTKPLLSRVDVLHSCAHVSQYKDVEEDSFSLFIKVQSLEGVMLSTKFGNHRKSSKMT